MSTLDRFRLTQVCDELKQIRTDLSNPHAKIRQRMDALIEDLEDHCARPIRLNTRHLRVGWERAERQGFRRGLLVMASVWIITAFLVSC